MRVVLVGRLLLALGLLVGLVASIGLLVGFEPAKLPPALLNLAAYKLTYLAALALLAVGAMFRRLGRRGVRDAFPRPLDPIEGAHATHIAPARSGHHPERWAEDVEAASGRRLLTGELGDPGTALPQRGGQLDGVRTRQRP
jgi:hypothetical protein